MVYVITKGEYGTPDACQSDRQGPYTEAQVMGMIEAGTVHDEDSIETKDGLVKVYQWRRTQPAMVIRDDRKPVRTDVLLGGLSPKEYFAPDAVLYDCPECGRAHFVTVDDCPDAETAAREAGMVRRAA